MVGFGSSEADGCIMEFLCKTVLIIGPRGLILRLKTTYFLTHTSILLAEALRAHCDNMSALQWSVDVSGEHVLL